MIGWAIGITVGFIFLTSIVVVAASMNSSRISERERRQYAENYSRNRD